MRAAKTTKGKKTETRVNRGTLAQKHSERLEKFAADQEILPEKRKMVVKMEKELGTLSRKSILSAAESRRKVELHEQIETVRTEIKKIEKCVDPLEYMTSVLPILQNYYDSDTVETGGVNEELMNEINSGDKRNVLSYLMRESEDSTPVKKTKKTTTIESDLRSLETPVPRVTRAKLHEDYLNIIDPSRRINPKDRSECVTPGCQGEKILHQAIGRYVCDVCGVEEEDIVVTDKPKFKDPVQDSSTYAYKRINHLTEILSQLQDKGMTEIPKDVYQAIYAELKKRNIDKKDLDIFCLRRILKKLNYRNYYEHVPHILQVINEKKPPNFTRKEEAAIKKMFKDIQEPFAIFCPKERKNFLNYSYFLHKACRILGLTQYIGYFPLLKNNKKLLQHDRIWKNICGYMSWPYHKSL